MTLPLTTPLRLPCSFRCRQAIISLCSRPTKGWASRWVGCLLSSFSVHSHVPIPGLIQNSISSLCPLTSNVVINVTVCSFPNLSIGLFGLLLGSLTRSWIRVTLLRSTLHKGIDRIGSQRKSVKEISSGSTWRIVNPGNIVSKVSFAMAGWIHLDSLYCTPCTRMNLPKAGSTTRSFIPPFPKIPKIPSLFAHCTYVFKFATQDGWPSAVILSRS